MIKWTKRLISAFGASFLWLICLIYFTQMQGFRSFVWTAISYQLKDKLKLSPAASQYVSSIAFFPWSIKPLYGIMSDCIPIRGRKRIPYLVIATVLSLVPWLILGSNSASRDSKWHLMIFLTVQNLGSAMADVVVDAMIAEAARYDRALFAGDLQSISWMAMALGGICGSLLGGYVLSNLQIDTIFLLFAVLPTIQLISCQFVVEKSVDSKNFQEYYISRVSTSNGSTSDEDSPFIEKFNRSIERRKKGKKNGKRLAVRTRKSDIVEKDDSLTLKQCHSIKDAIYDLCRAFRQPMILRCANIGLSLVNLQQIIVVSRMNTTYGISDKTMVLWGSALADAINQFKFMPFLIISGQLCPPGIEGTLFALFMSINNLGSTLGSFVGAGLASILNIDSRSFDNLLLGIIIHAICNSVPIAFLFLIPKEATGISA
ncbi:probable folate-biopterin transporter 4 isoform X3 [Prosopis cineraria]|uniref:probable folate-biopterin transporter 4 isoform X3 n=1 Tax=Prosopis cineraria TaxID=364024 RepID=UPI00240F092A|nr:probable folate-biopterin transporter 4 isoform X3 [Prosopis cineraria]